MRALRLAKRPLSSRSTSARGIGISLKCFWPGLGFGLGEPCRNTARTPDSCNPSIAASVCSGVVLLWHQSTIVVIPELMLVSAPIRLAMLMSSGRKWVARPRCMACTYCGIVQSPANSAAGTFCSRHDAQEHPRGLARRASRTPPARHRPHVPADIRNKSTRRRPCILRPPL